MDPEWMDKEEKKKLTDEERDAVYSRLWNRTGYEPSYFFLRMVLLYQNFSEPVDETDLFYLERTP